MRRTRSRRWPALSIAAAAFRRASWSNPWRRTACVVTAEDGTFGLGITTHGGPVQEIINSHFAPVVQGQDCMATETCWDVMRRISPAE